MDDNKWLILEALFRLKSLTAAAEELYISQSTLTRRLQQIEEEFGVLIAKRTAKGLTFTNEGVQLAYAAQEHINWHKALQKKFSGASQKKKLEIGLNSFFENNFLTPVEESFSSAYPDIEIKPSWGNSSLLVEKVQKQILKLAFVRGNHFFEGEKVLIHSSQVSILSGNPIEIKDLPNIPKIQSLHDPTVDKAFNQWWNENFSVPPKLGLTYSHQNLALQRIAKGHCYGIFAAFEKSSEYSNLFSLPTFDSKGNPLIHNLWMIYNDINDLSEAERTFVNFIKSNYAIVAC